MFKRARISLSIALIAATCGFLGLLDSPIAQTLFDFLLAFAFLLSCSAYLRTGRWTPAFAIRRRSKPAESPVPSRNESRRNQPVFDQSRFIKAEHALPGSVTRRLNSR